MTAQLNPQCDTRDYQQLDVAHHIYAFLGQRALNREGPRVMVRGENLRLQDNDGKHYLDGMPGLWCINLGYSCQDLAAAASRQLEQLLYYNIFFRTTHPAVMELSGMLFSLLPDHYSHAIYTNSDSKANEVLIRTVRRYWQILGKPQKRIMISRWNGYHGSTLGSTTFGKMRFMYEMGGMLPDFAHIDEPYQCANGGKLNPAEFGHRTALQLGEKILKLGAESVTAFIAKPFQDTGGVISPPQSYWPEIQRICRQYDVLLCADKVIGGFGRTGEQFAHEHSDFQPDTLSIAKGLTPDYTPMDGLVLGKRIAEALVEQGGVFAHGLTYSGHPVATAVAIANLKVLRDEGVVTRVREETGPYLQRCLREVFGDHPLVGGVQGIGFVIALQFVEDKAAYKHFANENDLAWCCRTINFEEGVIIRSTLGRIIMAPAPVAGRVEINELTDKTRITVDRTVRKVGIL